MVMPLDHERVTTSRVRIVNDRLSGVNGAALLDIWVIIPTIAITLRETVAVVVMAIRLCNGRLPRSCEEERGHKQYQTQRYFLHRISFLGFTAG